jgi:Rod binding domain-containing protein
MNIPALKPHVIASDIAPERLANNPQLTERQKIAEASRQFESILLKQVLEGAQKTVIKSKFSDDSTASGIYHDMVTTQLADSISKSGTLGLAKTFEQQLNRPEGVSKGGEVVSAASHSLKPLHSLGAATKSSEKHAGEMPALRGNHAAVQPLKHFHE